MENSEKTSFSKWFSAAALVLLPFFGYNFLGAAFSSHFNVPFFVCLILGVLVGSAALWFGRFSNGVFAIAILVSLPYYAMAALYLLLGLVVLSQHFAKS